MRKVLSILAVLSLTIPVVLAQTKTAAPAAAKMALDTGWKCGAPETPAAIPYPGQPDHSYSIYKITCTATKGTVNGVKEKSGMATEFADGTGASAHGHGIFMETLENGDTITYTYSFTGTMANKMMQAGTNTWTMSSATGKMKGITGTGTCAAKGNPDGSANFECKGTYAMGAAK